VGSDKFVANGYYCECIFSSMEELCMIVVKYGVAAGGAERRVVVNLLVV